MKKGKYLLFILQISVAVLAQLQTANAQTSMDTLKQYVTQLQNHPDDYVLREKIVRVSQNVKHLPAVPEDVERYTTRGKTAFSIDQTSKNYSNSIAEFQKATLSAPWLAHPYYNLAYAQEAAGDYASAVKNYKLYVLASPNAEDAPAVKTKIYELEYKAEQAQKMLKEKQDLEQKQKAEQQKLAEVEHKEKEEQTRAEQKKRKIEARKARLAKENALAETIKAERRIRDYNYFSIGFTVPLGSYGKNPSQLPPSTQFPMQSQVTDIINSRNGAGAKIFMDMNVGHTFYIKHMHVWSDRFKVGFDWTVLDGSVDRLNWKALGGNYDGSTYANTSYSPHYQWMFGLSSQFGPIFSISPAPKFFLDIYYRFSPALSFIYGAPVRAYDASDGVNSPPSYFQFQPTTTIGYDFRHSVGLNIRYAMLRVNLNFNLGRLVRQWRYTTYDAASGTTYTSNPINGSMFTPVFTFGLGFGIH